MQTNRWSCSVDALAIVLEKDVKDIIKIIGHDGSERWFNGLFPWRGFHVQELIDVCFHLGYTASIIEKTPTSASLYDDKEVFLPVALTRFQKYLEKFEGKNQKNKEILQALPIEMQPYYKQKAKEYFDKQ
jgi:hypothetical protein